jgi:metal-responsive CopG/Arc/MetJ family transcriptional regulator
MMDSVRFSISISKELYDKVAAYSERRLDSPSLNQVLREALVFYLAAMVTDSPNMVTLAGRCDQCAALSPA